MPNIPVPAPAVEPFHFGAAVEFTHILKRKMVRRPAVAFGENKLWRPEVRAGRGLLIGKRTLADGRRSYDSESGWEFTPSRHFGAYLVAIDMQANPVYVLPEHLTTAGP